MDRRSLIVGAACIGAAAVAAGLKPHKHSTLLGNSKMADLVPTNFSSWSAENGSGLVKPQTEGTLAAKLYSEMVERVYFREGGGELMMLIAYGDTQSDLLQLHRPESCYPAVGFTLVYSAPTAITLGNGVSLPGRRVVAQLGERTENIVYWTRLGEYLPISAGEQREARLLTAMTGYIPDGGLFRFSVVGPDRTEAFQFIERFIADLLHNVPVGQRKAMIGTRLANQLVA